MAGTTEIATRPSVSFALQLSTLQEIQEFCTILAGTNMVPKAYQDKPGDILVSILHGQEVGLPHLQALQSIAVVNGIPSIYGDAALALVRASGKLEQFDEWIEVDGVRQDGSFPILTYADEGKMIVAYCESKRQGMKPRKTSYSVDDAKRAKLWEKKGLNGFETPWCTVPQRMLMWRARGWNLRDNFGDVLKGLSIYEEAMDIETVKGTDEVHRPVVEVLPEPVREELQHTLSVGQAALKTQREAGPVPSPAPAASSPGADHSPATGAGDGGPRKLLSYDEACKGLMSAKTAHDVTSIMTSVDLNSLTPASKKELIAAKNMRLKQLEEK